MHHYIPFDGMRWLSALLACSCLASAGQAQLEPQPGERELQEEHKVPVLVEPPSVVLAVQPEFPELAQQQGLSGQVVLRLTVDDSGLVERVEVVESAGALFDWSALVAGTQLQFSGAVFAMQPEQGEPLPLCQPEPQEQGRCAQTFAAAVQIDYRMAFELQAPPEPPPEVAPPAAARLVGLIREAGSKRALEGVEVLIELSSVDPAFSEEDLEALAAVTEADGSFVFNRVPPGDHKIRLALSGYEPALEEQTFVVDEELQVIYYLVRRSYSKFTTVVRIKRPPKEVTKVALKREEVEKVPGTFGDPLRVIENLPGMARSGPIGGQLLVRGSSPSDSGVYFDSVEIPLLYHFGGLTSVINAEFLEDINYYPGGFGAKYGRATAGIIDVTSRKLDMDEYRGSGEVDLLDSGFFFAGPLDIGAMLGYAPAQPGPSPQKINFAAAARRSYIDAMIPFLIEMVVPPDQAVVTVAPVYWDYQFKLAYRPHKDHSLSFMAFGSDDDLTVTQRGDELEGDIDLAMHQNFHRLVAKYDAQLTSRIRNQFIANWGYIGFELGAGYDNNLEATANVGTYVAGVRDELLLTPFEKTEIVFGLDAGWVNYDLNFKGPVQASAGTYPRIIPNLEAEMEYHEGSTSWQPAFYTESRLGPFWGLTVIPGCRFDYYRYHDDKTLFSAEPRLAGRWQVVPGTTLKAAFGIYEQMAQPMQLSEKVGNPDLDLPRAMHYIVGYEHKLTANLNINVELFFNDKDRQVIGSEKATIKDGKVDLEFYNNRGIARSYGIELLLRHELSSDFYGWVAYTLSRSESRNSDQGMVINTGADGSQDYVLDPWYVTSFDQTHILTLVGQYRPPVVDLPSLAFQLIDQDQQAPPWLVDGWRNLSKDWSVGARFRLVTGNPTTPVLFAEHDLDTDSWDPKYGTVNSGRLPTFQQLDIRIDRKVVFDNFILNFYLDLLNAYNVENTEQQVWDYRYAEKASLAGLPILPVIGVQGEF